MRIGMTEAGDAGWDLSWFNKLQNNKFDGAILITKSCHRPEFQEKVLELYGKGFPLVIHAGITGWGGTPMEPVTGTPEVTVASLRTLIDNGFPADNIVLRIDPIFPTPEGVERAVHVLELADKLIPDVKRCRVSIYDDYFRSREEIIKRGYAPIDNITKWKNESERRPTEAQVDIVAQALIKARPDQEFELCAEPEVRAKYPDHFRWFGCLSKRDLNRMHLECPENVGINGQNRFGCRCLRIKTELLTNKRRCPNNCAYCYWGRN